MNDKEKLMLMRSAYSTLVQVNRILQSFYDDVHQKKEHQQAAEAVLGLRESDFSEVLILFVLASTAGIYYDNLPNSKLLQLSKMIVDRFFQINQEVQDIKNPKETVQQRLKELAADFDDLMDCVIHVEVKTSGA